MDKNCLNCFNFNDDTSTCKTMKEPQAKILANIIGVAQ